eukprot:6135176-Prymnesium_polylepis.1
MEHHSMADVIKALGNTANTVGIAPWHLTLDDVNCCDKALVPTRGSDKHVAVTGSFRSQPRTRAASAWNAQVPLDMITKAATDIKLNAVALWRPPNRPPAPPPPPPPRPNPPPLAPPPSPPPPPPRPPPPKPPPLPPPPPSPLPPPSPTPSPPPTPPPNAL